MYLLTTSYRCSTCLPALVLCSTYLFPDSYLPLTCWPSTYLPLTYLYFSCWITPATFHKFPTAFSRNPLTPYTARRIPHSAPTSRLPTQHPYDSQILPISDRPLPKYLYLDYYFLSTMCTPFDDLLLTFCWLTTCKNEHLPSTSTFLIFRRYLALPYILLTRYLTYIHLPSCYIGQNLADLRLGDCPTMQ